MAQLKELLEQIEEKKNKLDQFTPLPTTLINNLSKWLKVELTYSSNAIEGNTITRVETAEILEKGSTVVGKSLKEHLELLNYSIALDFIEKKRFPASLLKAV